MSQITRVSNEMKELINDFHYKLRSYGLNVTKTKATAIIAWLASRSFSNGNNEIRIKVLKPSGYRELRKTVIKRKKK